MSKKKRKNEGDRPRDVSIDSSTIKLVAHTGDKIHFPQSWLEERLQIEQAKDAALGISREHYPMHILLFPPSDSPLPAMFCNLADWLSSVSRIDLLPDHPDQAAMLRCIQFYWEARALWLTNEICHRYVADLPNLAIKPIVPKQAFDNLALEIPAEMARYQLLRSGEADIKQWCHKQGIDYPFPHALALFVETLREEFNFSLEFCFQFTQREYPGKVKRRHDYGDWARFFDGAFEESDPKYAELIAGLEASGWLGMTLLALREKRRAPHLKKLWDTFIRAQRKLTAVIDHRMIWKNGHPYYTRVTSHADPITCPITEDGYFPWHYDG